MPLQELLHDLHKIAEFSNDGEPLPIESFSVTNISEFNLVVEASSDTGFEESFLGAVATVFYPIEGGGEVFWQKFNLLLNQQTYLGIPPAAPSFTLKIDVPFWLQDLRLKIWKGLPDMPFSSTNPSIPNYPRATTIPSATSTAASATAVQVAAARPGRSKLTFYNDSNGTLYVRYAATGTGTSATAASGGWDDKIAPYTIYEYPTPALPPETAINGIWVAPSGTTLNGSCTVTEAVNS